MPLTGGSSPAWHLVVGSLPEMATHTLQPTESLYSSQPGPKQVLGVPGLALSVQNMRFDLKAETKSWHLALHLHGGGGAFCKQAVRQKPS